MESRAAFLSGRFKDALGFPPTASQDRMFDAAGEFLTTENGDILVVDGYAGTGKTSAVSSIISVLSELNVPVVLLAPTGRAAKVLSLYSGRPASTVHKQIYRQKSVDDSGTGLFSLAPNKLRGALIVVDEVSLIGIDSPSASAIFGSGNLLEDLVRYLRNGVGCKMLMIGDSAQLPPVGFDRSPALDEGFMSFAGGVEFVRMTDVVRQEASSGILRCATVIREAITSMSSDDIPVSALGLPSDCGPKVARTSGETLLDDLASEYSRTGQDGCIVLCRSNKRANRYNAGIRSRIQGREERLVRGDRLMIVRNCYHFVNHKEDGMEYIANGDMARLISARRYEQRYGLNFAQAKLVFPDYGDIEIDAKICLDVLESEAASLSHQQQQDLFSGVWEDYDGIASRKKRYDAVREDPFFNALQIKYSEAITCHKSQGGQWDTVFIDWPFWNGTLTRDDLKWLYTAMTRAVKKVYLINFSDEVFR